jgi:GrpB-like predicted nucleotidyltransferase (UPF0157 family)
MIRKVEVVPYNPNWHSLFETELKQITIALGKNAVAIHHIGSTSIETIYAKPIIELKLVRSPKLMNIIHQCSYSAISAWVNLGLRIGGFS